jgi:hypothetical protein
MVEKFNEQLNKKDLELILEVNKKAIDIQTEVTEQHEEILEALTAITNKQINHGDKIDKLVKQSEDTNRDIFKIQILFLSGLFSLIIQVIQLWRK